MNHSSKFKLNLSTRRRAQYPADDFSREAPGIEVDFSVPSRRVIRTLARIMAWRGKSEGDSL